MGDVVFSLLLQSNPKNLYTQHLVVRGSKKQQRRGWDYLNFIKRENFLVS